MVVVAVVVVVARTRRHAVDENIAVAWRADAGACADAGVETPCAADEAHHDKMPDGASAAVVVAPRTCRYCQNSSSVVVDDDVDDVGGAWERVAEAPVVVVVVVVVDVVVEALIVAATAIAQLWLCFLHFVF